MQDTEKIPLFDDNNSDKISDKDNFDRNARKTKSNRSISTIFVNKRVPKHNLKLFDEIVEQIGYGREQVFMIMIAGMNFMLQGIYYFILSALFLSFKKFYSIGDTEVAVAASLLYAGGIVTGYLLGYLASFGRTKLVTITSFIIFLAHLGMCSYQNYYTLCISMIIIGGALNLNGPMITNILAEYLPIRLRAFSMGTIWGWYSIGNIILLVIYMTYVKEYEVNRFKYYLIILTIFPLFNFLTNLIFLKDSSRSMLHHEDPLVNKEGLLLLGRMWSRTDHWKNWRDSKDGKNKLYIDDTIENQKNETISKKESLNENEKVRNTEKMKEKEVEKNNESIMTIEINKIFSDDEQQELVHQLKEEKKELDNINEQIGLSDLFTGEFKTMSALLTISWILNSFIGYGPFFVMPLTLNEYFNGKDPTDTGGSEYDIIKSQMLVHAVGLLANPLGGFLCEIDFLGRKHTASVTALLSLILNFVLVVNMNNIVLYLTIHNFINTINFNTMITYTAEAYPTRLRDFSSGYMNSMGNIGASIGQPLYVLFHLMNLRVPYIATAVFCLISAVCYYLLPYDTIGMELDYVNNVH